MPFEQADSLNHLVKREFQAECAFDPDTDICHGVQISSRHVIGYKAAKLVPAGLELTGKDEKSFCRAISWVFQVIKTADYVACHVPRLAICQ